MKEIQLTQGQVALVDDEDFDWLNQSKWCAQNTRSGFYAARYQPDGKYTLMQRLIMGIVDRKIKVDHIDRNTLNNQRDNLRIATHSQNMANRKVCQTSSSKYLGVSWCNRDRKWKVNISKNRKKIWVGGFHDEIEAAISYNKKALELHGEFANLNVIPCGY